MNNLKFYRIIVNIYVLEFLICLSLISILKNYNCLVIPTIFRAKPAPIKANMNWRRLLIVVRLILIWFWFVLLMQ